MRVCGVYMCGRFCAVVRGSVSESRMEALLLPITGGKMNF